MPRIFTVLTIVALFLTAACNPLDRIQSSGTATTRFHQRLDTEQYAAIYDETSQQFRKTTSESDFLALLAAVHRKLGAFKTSEERGLQINATPDGISVTLTYDSTFAAGHAAETFQWLQQEGNCWLANYQINSNTLILK